MNNNSNEQIFDSIHVTKNYDMLVVWSLGNFCPYTCSYCPDYFHNGEFKYHSYDIVLKTFKSLPEKSRIIFSGGEPTYHPDIEKILDSKISTHSIGVISNAARNIGFWERILPKLDLAIFTFHAEFANIDRFIETSQLCKSKLEQINLTMIPEKWDVCISAYERFLKEGLPVSPKPLMEDFGFKSTSMIPGYTSEQIAWIRKQNLENSPKFIILKNSAGEIVGKSNPSQLLAGGNSNFNGWICNTPAERLYIQFNGEIHSTSCKQKVLVGTVQDGFTPLTEPAICRQNICWSHSDMSSFKSKKYP